MAIGYYIPGVIHLNPNPSYHIWRGLQVLDLMALCILSRTI
jgi:hypothetical protein